MRLIVILFLIIFTGCATKYKYKVGDCIVISSLHNPIKKENGSVFFPGGYHVASLKVEKIEKIGKSKTDFYVVKMKNTTSKEWWKTWRKELQYFPVKDLDQFRLARLVWEPKGKKEPIDCNYYGD